MVHIVFHGLYSKSIMLCVSALTFVFRVYQTRIHNVVALEGIAVYVQ